MLLKIIFNRFTMKTMIVIVTTMMTILVLPPLPLLPTWLTLFGFGKTVASSVAGAGKFQGL